MDKICVYTCITGNYDNLIELNKIEENIDYICFTNNKNLNSDTWNIRYINEDIDNLTLARKVKILGYKYLEEYDTLIWIDGAINIIKSINTFLNDCCNFNKYDMIAFKHQNRDCIFDEINECVRLNKETVENAIKLEQFLEKSEYPRHNGLIESTILVRKNVSSVNKLMDDWFNMLITYSRRDQLSFNYCLWKNPIRIDFLDMYVFNNDYFKHRGHNRIRKSNKYRIIYGDSYNFDYKKVKDSYFTVNDNRVVIEQICEVDTNKIVIELFDEIGSTISNVEINNNANHKLYNIYDLGDKVYFYDKPIIVFEGNFRINSQIIISFELLRNSDKDLVNSIYIKNNIILELMEKENKYKDEIESLKYNINNFNQKYDKLKQEYKNLEIEHGKVINSKGWKIISKVRNMKDKVYIKKR